ncbi:hypothetical protein GCM10028791_22860 [Echinicola sediminis]
MALRLFRPFDPFDRLRDRGSDAQQPCFDKLSNRASTGSVTAVVWAIELVEMCLSADKAGLPK